MVGTVVLVAGAVLITAWAQASDCRATGRWRCLTSMPTPRSEMQAAASDGRIYVAGGIGIGGRVHAAFEAFDVATGTWESLPTLPGPRHHSGLAALDGRIYLAGGYDSIRFGAGSRAFHVYDPSDHAWSELAPMPSERAAHALVPLDGRLWVVGGVGSEPDALWSFDPVEGAWRTDHPPLPTPREHLAAVGWRGRLVVLGGRWDEANLATVEAFDPERGTWSAGPDLPEPRGGLTAAVVADEIHATGGEDLGTGDVHASHFVLADLDGSWRSDDRLPRGRHGLASAGIAGTWYVLGGALRAGAMTVVSVVGTTHAFDVRP